MLNLEEFIKEKCHDKRITLRFLCKEIGMTEPALQKVFKRNSTSKKTLEKMAVVLGISVDDFYSKNIKNTVTIPMEEYLDLIKMKEKLATERAEKAEKNLHQSKNIEVVPE